MKKQNELNLTREQAERVFVEQAANVLLSLSDIPKEQKKSEILDVLDNKNRKCE